MRLKPWMIATLAGIGAASGARAECQLNKLVDLPVTMNGARPQLYGKINGRDARFMVDSGAFWSVMSAPVAAEYGLHLSAAPAWLHLVGVGGSSTAEVVNVETLTLGNLPVRGVQFVVAGSEIGGGAGVIGQNVLHYADVEYDLAHGRVGLFKPHDCGSKALAYWSNDQPLSVLDTDDQNIPLARTIATIFINGKRVRALFDTGASSTVLSKSAAARLGIKLDGPGVEHGGYSRGFGSRAVPSWVVPIDDIKIGGEELRNNRIEVIEMSDSADVLVGADFFLAHRVYVANSQHKIYFTYLGGNFFNPKRKNTKAVDGEGKALEIADTSDAPADADGFSRRGMVSASKGDVAAGIADLTKAIEMAPAEPRFLVQRARLYRRRGQPALARADLDRALSVKPGDTDALLDRANLRMSLHDRPGALADVNAASKALDKGADARGRVAEMLIGLDEPAAAIAEFTIWIDAHPVDAGQAMARNDRCWARALANQDLPRALADCNSALKTMPHREAGLDSRGLVHFRMGDYAAAIADDDAALAIDPKMAWPLYVRGLAKLKLGDKAGGEADIAAARASAPHAVERAVKYGLAP